MFKTEQFVLVNGYSNMYWGWGAEDDDMTTRILSHGLRIYRPPSNIARYKMVKHDGRKSSEVSVRLVASVSFVCHFSCARLVDVFGCRAVCNLCAVFHVLGHVIYDMRQFIQSKYRCVVSWTFQPDINLACQLTNLSVLHKSSPSIHT